MILARSTSRSYPRLMQISPRIGLIAVLALGLVAAPLAEAKSPPKDKYQCSISGVGFYGNLFITGKKTYKFGLDGKYKKGTYSAKGKVASGTYKGQYKIRFRTGRLKGHRGRWTRYQIALIPPGRSFENIYCARR